MAQIDGLLKLMIERGASDLHLKVGSPPAIRVNGKLVLLKEIAPLTPEQTAVLARGVMDDTQKLHLDSTRETDFAYSLPGVGRFRFNVFRQRGSGHGSPFRIIGQ